MSHIYINKLGEISFEEEYKNPEDENASSGTSLMDIVAINYSQIVDVFGEPNIDSDQYKTFAEWHIYTPDGIATIYDYKSPWKPEINREWHIGGNDVSVLRWVYKALLEGC